MDRHIPFPSSYHPMLSPTKREARTDSTPYSIIKQSTTSLISGIYKAGQSIIRIATDSISKLKRGTQSDYTTKKRSIFDDEPTAPQEPRRSFQRDITVIEPINISVKKLKLEEDVPLRLTTPANFKPYSKAIDYSITTRNNAYQTSPIRTYKSRETDTPSFKQYERENCIYKPECEEHPLPKRYDIFKSIESSISDNITIEKQTIQRKSFTRQKPIEKEPTITKKEVKDLLEDVATKLLKEIRDSHDVIKSELKASKQDIINQNSKIKEKVNKIEIHQQITPTFKKIETERVPDVVQSKNIFPTEKPIIVEAKVEEKKFEEPKSIIEPKPTTSLLLGGTEIKIESKSETKTAPQLIEPPKMPTLFPTEPKKENASTLFPTILATTELKPTSMLPSSIFDMKKDNYPGLFGNKTDNSQKENKTEGTLFGATNFNNSSLFVTKPEEKKQEAPKQTLFPSNIPSEEKNAEPQKQLPLGVFTDDKKSEQKPLFSNNNSLFNANTFSKSTFPPTGSLFSNMNDKPINTIGSNPSVDKMAVDSTSMFGSGPSLFGNGVSAFGGVSGNGQAPSNSLFGFNRQEENKTGESLFSNKPIPTPQVSMFQPSVNAQNPSSLASFDSSSFAFGKKSTKM